MSLLEALALGVGSIAGLAAVIMLACIRMAGISSRREGMLLDERDSSHDSARLGRRE